MFGKVFKRMVYAVVIAFTLFIGVSILGPSPFLFGDGFLSNSTLLILLSLAFLEISFLNL